MCVIVFLPANQTLDESVLKQCFDKNPDGWGLMYAKDGSILTTKDITGFPEFYQAYQQMPTDVHRCVHFRIKTHGEKNQENCHPFRIQLDSAEYTLMHNGMFHIPEFNEAMSDTWHFARLLEGMYKEAPDLLFDKAIQDEISSACGQSSKIILMNQAGGTMRYGLWTERHKCWFSNTTWEYTPQVYPIRNYGCGGIDYLHAKYDCDLNIWVPDEGYEVTSKKNIESDTNESTDTEIQDQTQKALDDISRVQEFIDATEAEETSVLDQMLPFDNALIELNRFMNQGDYIAAVELMLRDNITAEDAAPYMDDIEFASKMLQWFLDTQDSVAR